MTSKDPIYKKDISNEPFPFALRLDQFHDVVKRFDAYVRDNKSKPVKIAVRESDGLFHGNYISLEKYGDMWNRYAIYQDVYKYEPNIIYLNIRSGGGGVPVLPKPPENMTFTQKLQVKYGKFDTYCGFVDKVLKNRINDYVYYSNSEYSMSTLKQMLLGSGAKINCADAVKITSIVVEELGYDFRVKNVVCSVSEGVHIRMDIKGPTDDDWVCIDPAAAVDKFEGNTCLDVWCDSPPSSIVDISPINELFEWMDD
ncbi:MAG: hypothetical protein LBC39_03300 [Methanobrevibacter sp.]|jgi:hypothetical protein|nr:hypothetical protein [Candidatus Methanovirga aequatorialis]